MQSVASIGRGLYRITFRGGSPQRIHYSRALTLSALAALIVLAVTLQFAVVGGGTAGAVLHLFTMLCGSYLALAIMSRRVPLARLRQAFQAALLVVVCAHAAVLLAAPLIHSVGWAGYLAAALIVAAGVVGLTNCVHFALGGARSRAAAVTAGFVLAVVAFYATMTSLVAIAVG